jgi:hypothetical protein
MDTSENDQVLGLLERGLLEGIIDRRQFADLTTLALKRLRMSEGCPVNQLKDKDQAIMLLSALCEKLKDRVRELELNGVHGSTRGFLAVKRGAETPEEIDELRSDLEWASRIIATGGWSREDHDRAVEIRMRWSLFKK